MTEDLGGGLPANGRPPAPIPDLGIPEGFGLPGEAGPAAGTTPVGPPPVAPTGVAPAPAPPSAVPTGVPTAPAPPSAGPVTDDDRTAYGRLLDSAFERGLLNTYQYEVRLKGLSEATSIEELRRLVTELPAFDDPLGSVGTGTGTGVTGGFGRPSGSGSGRRRRTSPWLLLAIVVLFMAFFIALLTVFASHVAHTHSGGALAAASARLPVTP